MLICLQFSLIAFLILLAPIQQRTPNDLPLVSENVCESNKAYISEGVANARGNDQDSIVIVIARLGRGETSSEYNWRRLRTVGSALHLTLNIPSEKMVLAEGQRTKNFPQVEVYVRGKLAVQINIKPHENIDFGSNGACEEQRNLRIKK